MLLTPINVARGALLKFCRICERREGPGSGLGIVQRVRVCWQFRVFRYLFGVVCSSPFIRVPHYG